MLIRYSQLILWINQQALWQECTIKHESSIFCNWIVPSNKTAPTLASSRILTKCCAGKILRLYLHFLTILQYIALPTGKEIISLVLCQCSWSCLWLWYQIFPILNSTYATLTSRCFCVIIAVVNRLLYKPQMLFYENNDILDWLTLIHSNVHRWIVSPLSDWLLMCIIDCAATPGVLFAKGSGKWSSCIMR